VEHDNMNVLCLGARVIGPELMLDLVRAFMASHFTGEERHRRRLGKIAELELRFSTPLRQKRVQRAPRCGEERATVSR
jgi:ribose 5-phosphate isomerase B